MFDFVYRPPSPDTQIVGPKELAADAMEFITRTAHGKELEVGSARARLADANEKYDEDDYTDARVIATAEERFESAQEAFQHATLKHLWEKDGNWKPIARLAARIAWTKDLLSKIDWSRIRSPKR